MAEHRENMERNKRRVWLEHCLPLLWKEHTSLLAIIVGFLKRTVQSKTGHGKAEQARAGKKKGG